MQLSVAWPSTGTPLVFWTAVMLVWMAVHYLLTHEAQKGAPPPPSDDAIRAWKKHRPVSGATIRFSGTRAIALAAVVLALAGLSWKSLALATWAGLLAFLLIAGRSVVTAGYPAILWELALHLVFTATTALLVGTNGLDFGHVLLVLPVSDGKIACAVLIAAALVFLGRGGTYIVRNTLIIAGTMPRFGKPAARDSFGVVGRVTPGSSTGSWDVSAVQVKVEASSDDPKGGGQGVTEVGTDITEFRRGRLIGNMERVLIAFLALGGSYPAIGFIMAAKGLVRAKEFEDRDYAEYFLVGTLASTTLALVVGALLRIAIQTLWGS